MSVTRNDSLGDFKQFLKNHPLLVKEVRRGIYSWQEIYEEWYLLGEENEVWDRFRNGDVTRIDDEKKQESADKAVLSSLFDALKSVDVQSMQKHVTNLSQALGTISGVISQFQTTSDTQEADDKKKSKSKSSSFRRD